MAIPKPHTLMLVLGLCWLPLLVSGQQPMSEADQKRFIGLYQKGDELLEKKSLKRAERAFLEVIKIKPDFASAYRRLGLVYELQKDFPKAAEYYDQCITITPKLSRAAWFQAGEMYLKSGNYEVALERLKSYRDFQQLPPESFEEGEKELSTEAYFNQFIDNHINDCQFALQHASFKEVKVDNLGASINSPANDCFPYLANDESWMFYTRLTKGRSDEENLMYSSASRGAWTKGKPLGEVINSDVNEGMGKATRDEKKMYFPICNREDVLGVCDIFMADMEDGKILEVQSLNGYANSDRFDSQPSINCDGQALYFVSDREGGYGGTDIWVSYKEEDGRWSEAENLGATINTPDFEESPFIADDGVTLYFVSDGHKGYGDQDIYFSRKSQDGQWSKPKNLGQPINSPGRELSFFMNARGNKGYFASDRSGGFGGLDIYQFDLPKKKDFEEIAYVKGIVVDSFTGKPVPTMVEIAGKGVFKTDENGTFFICYPTLSGLPTAVMHDRYYEYEKRHSLLEWNEQGFAEITLYLQPLNPPVHLAALHEQLTPKGPPKEEKIEVKPLEVKEDEETVDKEIYTTSDVYFYFDEFSLTREARYNLDRLIEDIDEDRLALIVVEGFADQIGTDDYNLQLSEKRAKEVADFFKAKGFDNLKITYKGYGETRSSLIYSKNRKVDVIVYYKI
jgi:outer membrane protein OmpA-like peptidoglycan-associated protein/tetratricopeptide (TPR) repeat protein